jgi:mono/diheme cytochrome c family protein
MPAARFAQPTTMIGVALQSATGDEVEASENDVDADAVDSDAVDVDAEADAGPDEEESAEPVETPSPPGPDLARGATVYQVRGCGDCHGANGEGVPGEGSALVGLTLSESEFTTILRTGGSGRLGPSHLYGPSAISPGGMSALYAWLDSLDD